MTILADRGGNLYPTGPQGRAVLERILNESEQVLDEMRRMIARLGVHVDLLRAETQKSQDAGLLPAEPQHPAADHQPDEEGPEGGTDP